MPYDFNGAEINTSGQLVLNIQFTMSNGVVQNESVKLDDDDVELIKIMIGKQQNKDPETYRLHKKEK